MIGEKIAYLNGLPIRVQACKVKDYPPHWHDEEIEIIYILEGAADIIVSFDHYKVRKGDFVLINQGEIHHIHADGESVIISLYIQLDRFSASFCYIRYIYFCWQSFNLNRKQIKSCRLLEKLIFGIFIEITNDSVYDSGKMVRYVNKIIQILIGDFDIIHSFNHNVITNDQLTKYHHIIKFIEENYSEKISMTDIAREEYMGRNYVSQFWKKITDMNFTEFLNCRRVELAEKLILTTSLSLQSISLQCGFSDPKYFYKYFKKWYQCTPLEHRKKYNELYEKLPAVYETIEPAQFKGIFEKLLTDHYVEEADCDDHSEAVLPEGNRTSEEKINKYLKTRLKKELIKENLKHNSIKNLHLGLFASGMVGISEHEYFFDWSIIDSALKFAEDLDLNLCIDIDLMQEEVWEWELIMKKLSRHIKTISKNGSPARLKYIVYLSELEKASDVKNIMSKYMNLNNMEISIKL